MCAVINQINSPCALLSVARPDRVTAPELLFFVAALAASRIASPNFCRVAVFRPPPAFCRVPLKLPMLIGAAAAAAAASVYDCPGARPEASTPYVIGPFGLSFGSSRTRVLVARLRLACDASGATSSGKSKRSTLPLMITLIRFGFTSTSTSEVF